MDGPDFEGSFPEIDVDATVAAALESWPADMPPASEADVRAEIEALAEDLRSFRRTGDLTPRLMALAYGGPA